MLAKKHDAAAAAGLPNDAKGSMKALAWLIIHAAAADWLKGDAALYALADRVFAERVARWGAAVAATRLCPRPVRGPCANAPG